MIGVLFWCVCVYNKSRYTCLWYTINQNDKNAPYTFVFLWFFFSLNRILECNLSWQWTAEGAASAFFSCTSWDAAPCPAPCLALWQIHEDATFHLKWNDNFNQHPSCRDGLVGKWHAYKHKNWSLSPRNYMKTQHIPKHSNAEYVEIG